ncbi:MAG: HAMP domain-containing protein [Acidimicrobiia bacterium]|nr:HAMP domain-containing protein [Acidimicrobiia bacterium]
MRRRLLFSYLTLTLVVLLLLELPLGFVYAREQRRRLTASVERDALALSIRAEEGLESNGVAALRTLARNYENDTGGRVVVVRPDGSLVADSQAGERPPENFANRPEIKAALARREAIGSRSSKTLGHDILFFAIPIVHGNELVGALRVTYPTSYVDTRIREGWWVLVGIGVIVLLIVFLVSLQLARQVTIPIERLAAASARFGGGALDARAEVPPGPPELRDLTEQFNATAARVEGLVHSQREFVADASHQLRTPLAALRLRLENLESDLAGSEDAAADVAGSLAEVGRLSRLVDGLLELARAERQSDTPAPAPLGPIVEGRVEAWSAFADEHSVHFDTEIAPGLTVRTAPGRLEQVFDNLIANAIDVSPEGGTIRIDATRRGAMIVVRVADDGPGMRAEQRARAFDRFWRASGNRGGSGLGLAIVRQLVEADGGRVALDESPSGGLTAVIELRRS